jgi:hypothetical protein
MGKHKIQHNKYADNMGKHRIEHNKYPDNMGKHRIQRQCCGAWTSLIVTINTD